VHMPRTDKTLKAPARRAGRPANPTDVPAEPEILARGLAAFAELGYERASVRELADAWGSVTTEGGAPRPDPA
jgi:hypothetical protein